MSRSPQSKDMRILSNFRNLQINKSFTYGENENRTRSKSDFKTRVQCKTEKYWYLCKKAIPVIREVHRSSRFNIKDTETWEIWNKLTPIITSKVAVVQLIENYEHFKCFEIYRFFRSAAYQSVESQAIQKFRPVYTEKKSCAEKLSQPWGNFDRYFKSRKYDFKPGNMKHITS